MQPGIPSPLCQAVVRHRPSVTTDYPEGGMGSDVPTEQRLSGSEAPRCCGQGGPDRGGFPRASRPGQMSGPSQRGVSRRFYRLSAITLWPARTSESAATWACIRHDHAQWFGSSRCSQQRDSVPNDPDSVPNDPFERNWRRAMHCAGHIEDTHDTLQLSPAVITPVSACHQPSHTPQLDSKLKAPVGKANLLYEEQRVSARGHADLG